MLAFDKERLVADLSSISREKQLAFALLAFERMWPSLVTFSGQHERDLSAYANARDVAWHALSKRRSVPDLARSLSDQCMKDAPDTEDFPDSLVSYALNAGLSLSHIMDFLANGRVDDVVSVASLAHDSLYLYLQTFRNILVSTTESDRKIANHPVMQQELRRQRDDFTFLVGLPDEFTIESVARVRERANRQGLLLPGFD